MGSPATKNLAKGVRTRGGSRKKEEKMAEKKKLFEKSTDELREAFVKARFAQEDVFGRADIKEWLKGQRDAERPDNVSWQRFLVNNFIIEGINPFFLRDYATTVKERGEESIVTREEAPFARIYLGLVHGLYLGQDGVGIFIEQHDIPLIITEKHDRLMVDRAFFNDPNMGCVVTKVIFAEWLCGYPKWPGAQRYLCDALAAAITAERAKAEADFNRAVAVSADGTKIVCADEVIILTCDEKFFSYPPKAFVNNKIFRCEEIIKGELLSLLWPLTRELLRCKGDKQIYDHGYSTLLNGVLTGYGDEKKRFFTHAKFCPEPPPEGGVELEV
jgi:hypothetical protein